MKRQSVTCPHSPSHPVGSVDITREQTDELLHESSDGAHEEGSAVYVCSENTPDLAMRMSHASTCQSQ
jgi:hypothetical protein